MTENRLQKEKDRFITILVLKDRLSEPLQFQLNRRWLEYCAYFAVIFPSLLLVSLLATGSRCVSVSKENHKLYSLTQAYRASDRQLNTLGTQMAFIEVRTAQSARRTQSLIAAMSKDLKRWLPHGAVGGGASDVDVLSPPNTPPRPPSSSQLERVGDLEARLARLDSRLNSFDWTIKEIEKSWDERNSLFSSMPSFWPIGKGRITSVYGVRIHPIIRRLQMHEGIDISAPLDTLIYAAGQGIVTYAGNRSGYGNVVTIDHGFGFSTHYAHCRELLVRAGQPVKKGQPIAKVGSTGLSTGPHLHFEVRIKGVPVDPFDYVSIFSRGPE